MVWARPRTEVILSPCVCGVSRQEGRVMREGGWKNQGHALSHQMETTIPLRKGVEDEGRNGRWSSREPR